MNNYEAIKKMSIEEMAAMLYIFEKPFFDTFGLSEEQKQKSRDEIMAFLKAEAHVKRGAK